MAWCTDFEGDLEDYSNWLEKRGSTASTPVGAQATRRQRAWRQATRQKRKDGDARKDLAPKRQEIKIHRDIAGQARAGTRQAREGARRARLRRDAAHARKVTERHAALIREIEQMETRWLELSERLESLNG